jgi:hypothetical protein
MPLARLYEQHAVSPPDPKSRALLLKLATNGDATSNASASKRPSRRTELRRRKIALASPRGRRLASPARSEAPVAGPGRGKTDASSGAGILGILSEAPG